MDQLEKLRGSKLSSVEFVHDYVQLQFDGRRLTLNAPFFVLVDECTYEKDRKGYRDALCERIGRKIEKAATIPDESLKLQFDDGAQVVVSLKPEDQTGPEAAVLMDGAKQVCVW